MGCTHRKIKLVDFDERFSFSCHACNQMGYGMCYQCKYGCDYKLHEECIRASPEAYYSFFGNRAFRLQYRPLINNTGDLCTACGMGVSGLMYVCSIDWRSNIFLHPCCMTLPPSIVTNGERFTLKKQLVYLECQHCERRTLTGTVDGWAYVSADQELACHVQCMKNKLYEDWIKHTFVEETQQVVLTKESWWESPDYDDGGSTSSSNVSSPAHSSHGHSSTGGSNAWGRSSSSNSNSNVASPVSWSQAQEQNTLALIETPKPKRTKRRILWKFTKVAAQIFIHAAVGDAVGAIFAFHHLL